jgi:signal peptidase I
MPDPHPSEHFLSDTNQLDQDFTVPEGKYFVLGDNRERSEDSRFFKEPFIPREHLVGKFGLEIAGG